MGNCVCDSWNDHFYKKGYQIIKSMNIALVLASGSGTRMKESTPKQFILVNNKPLLIYTLEAFQNNQNIDMIVVVTLRDYIVKVKEWAKEFGLSKVNAVLVGGDTRQASSYNGLCALEALGVNYNDVVLIHDAARANVSQEIINENIIAGKTFDAVETVIPVTDTIIKSANANTLTDTCSRKELYQAQTPQTFKLGVIKKAHEMFKDSDASDDAQLVSKLNIPVYLVNGSKLNFKITTKEDLILFENLHS